LLEPGEPKDTDDSAVFQLWQAFATEQQTAEMRQQFADGIAWGEAKKQLFELINDQLQAPRERYNQLIENPAEVEKVLQQGAEKARLHSAALLADVRKAVGIRPLG
jgi:tryptophanyl-tRNA synthetase